MAKGLGKHNTIGVKHHGMRTYFRPGTLHGVSHSAKMRKTLVKPVHGRTPVQHVQKHHGAHEGFGSRVELQVWDAPGTRSIRSSRARGKIGSCRNLDLGAYPKSHGKKVLLDHSPSRLLCLIQVWVGHSDLLTLS